MSYKKGQVCWITWMNNQSMLDVKRVVIEKVEKPRFQGDKETIWVRMGIVFEGKEDTTVVDRKDHEIFNKESEAYIKAAHSTYESARRRFDHVQHLYSAALAAQLHEKNFRKGIRISRKEVK